MTRRPKQKIRFKNDRPTPDRSPQDRPSVRAEGQRTEPAPPVQYFEVRPANLPPRLDSLKALTKSGVRGYPDVDAAQALLAGVMRKDRVRGDVLDLSAMGGLLGSLPGVTLRAVEGSAAALSALNAAGLDAHAAVPGEPLTERWPDRARTVALILAGDRGNAYAAAQVAWAHACTPPGGTLYIAGDRDKGFDRYVRLAGNAFGAGEVVARDGGMRVAKLIRRPGPTPALPDPEGFEAFGVTVVGLPGVFSAAKPDKATALMLGALERLDPDGTALSGKDVLDLGCGTGLIGAWAARRGATVTLLDGDLPSVRSAQATLAASGLTGTAVHSDVDAALDPAATFDLILTNPPFHVGRGVVLDVAREFIAAATRRLRPGGTLHLVANDFLPYEADLRTLGDVRETLREAGFKVLSVTRA